MEGRADTVTIGIDIFSLPINNAMIRHFNCTPTRLAWRTKPPTNITIIFFIFPYKMPIRIIYSHRIGISTTLTSSSFVFYISSCKTVFFCYSRIHFRFRKKKYLICSIITSNSNFATPIPINMIIIYHICCLNCIFLF